MNDGTVEQIGSPKQVYHNPQNKFVANFLGESNQLDAKLIENNNNKSVAEINESGIRFSLINGTKSNSRTGSVVFRPEDIEFGIDSDQKNTFDAYIETSLFTGGKTRCEIALEGGSKIIAFSNKFREPDSSVTVTVPPEKVQFIAGD
jgi:ABC-type Fe3+/spermidine/putrescine transport system ATPase subunit